MPIRMLRDWTDSEKMNALTVNAEIFFTRLIMKVDDLGCFYADLRLLRANLYPLKIEQIKEADISKWMAECEAQGLLTTYEIDGKRFLQIENFKQRLDKARSRFPTPGNVDFNKAPGYVYLIGSTLDQPVKIGYSNNPWARLKEVSRSENRSDLSILMTFKGAVEDEQEIHKILYEFNYEKEWFFLIEEVIACVKESCDMKRTAKELIVAIRSIPSFSVYKTVPAEIETEKKKPNKKRESSKISIQDREKSFVGILAPFVNTYGKEMIREFFDYWREPNKSGTKMKFELQKTWNVELRLKRWSSHDNRFNNKPVTPELPAHMQQSPSAHVKTLP